MYKLLNGVVGYQIDAHFDPSDDLHHFYHHHLACKVIFSSYLFSD
jgi:hypothetical protein